ncbi:MAG: hypothetical protein ABIO44_02040, partial [Saprospiraceae bacterium]
MLNVIKPLILLCFYLGFSNIFGQCTPAASDSCETANVLCSLDQVNGYKCKNTDISNQSGCKPLCPSGGVPNNTSWWAFVSGGGDI